MPGIKKNYDALAQLLKDDEALHKIGFQNAYDLFGFWKEGLFEVRDEEEIFRVANDAASRYKAPYRRTNGTSLTCLSKRSGRR